MFVSNFYDIMYLQAEEDPMMAQVQLVAQKKLITLREKERELQQQVSRDIKHITNVAS